MSNIPNFRSGFRKADTVFLRKIILELGEDFIDIANKIVFDIEQEYNNKEILENSMRNDKVAIYKKYQAISNLVKKMEKFDRLKNQYIIIGIIMEKFLKSMKGKAEIL